MSAVRFRMDGTRILNRIQIDKCHDCEMGTCDPMEFHPFAACQVFQETHDSDAVWAEIKPMLDAGIAGGRGQLSTAAASADADSKKET